MFNLYRYDWWSVRYQCLILFVATMQCLLQSRHNPLAATKAAQALSMKREEEEEEAAAAAAAAAASAARGGDGPRDRRGRSGVENADAADSMSAASAEHFLMMGGENMTPQPQSAGADLSALSASGGAIHV